MSTPKTKEQLLHFRKPAFEALETRRLLDASNSTSPLVENFSGFVPAQTATNKLMQFKIELIDRQGQPIERIYVDDEFLLQVFVRDLRDLPSDEIGIFTAFTTLRLDRLLERTGEGRVGNAFFTLKDMDPSRMEIGGMSNTIEPNGTNPLLLFEVPVRAIADGEGTIATAPIEGFRGSTMLPMLQYGFSEPTPTHSIDFASLPLTVLPRTSLAPIESVPTVPAPITPPNVANEQTTQQPGQQPVIVASPFFPPSDSEDVIESDEFILENKDRFVDQETSTANLPTEISMVVRSLYRSSVVWSPHQTSSPTDRNLGDVIVQANDRIHSVKRAAKRSAVEVVDGILSRLQANDDAPIPFEWENTFGRAPLSRLPLNPMELPGKSYSNEPYGNDGFAEIDQYFGFIQSRLPTRREIRSCEKCTVVQSHADWAVDGAYQRASLPMMSLIDHNRIRSMPTQDDESKTASAAVELSAALESQSDIRDSKFVWLNRLIVGLASLLVVLDRRPTRREAKSPC